MRRDIKERVKQDKKWMRMLTCGHTVLEPHGSKAKFAKWADCRECDAALSMARAFGKTVPEQPKKPVVMKAPTSALAEATRRLALL